MHWVAICVITCRSGRKYLNLGSQATEKIKFYTENIIPINNNNRVKKFKGAMPPWFPLPPSMVEYVHTYILNVLCIK